MDNMVDTDDMDDMDDVTVEEARRATVGEETAHEETVPGAGGGPRTDGEGGTGARRIGRPEDSDPWDLARFLADQERGGSYERAMRELRAGAKRGHWIWYVLPQLRGLGRSELAQRYGLRGLDEARAYLAHPVLGARLRDAAEAVLRAGEGGASAEHVMGSTIDALKLRSSMTLFDLAASASDDVLARREPADATCATVFHAVLTRYFDGVRDTRTLELLDNHQGPGSRADE